MSASNLQKISKMETAYVHQHESSKINNARRKRVLYRRLIVFFFMAAAITYLMVSTLISQNAMLSEKVEEKEKLKDELASLKQEEVILKEEVVKLNDDQYIAMLARSEYFLSDKNEIIFTLPEKEKHKLVESSN